MQCGGAMEAAVVAVAAALEDLSGGASRIGPTAFDPCKRCNGRARQQPFCKPCRKPCSGVHGGLGGRCKPCSGVHGGPGSRCKPCSGRLGRFGDRCKRCEGPLGSRARPSRLATTSRGLEGAIASVGSTFWCSKGRVSTVDPARRAVEGATARLGAHPVRGESEGGQPAAPPRPFVLGCGAGHGRARSPP